MLLRPARPEEAGFLSDLAVRAKGYWGYDADFLEDCRIQLAVYPDEVVTRRVTVAAKNDVIVGFYALDGRPPAGELSLMFVDPEHIRGGVGRQLWAHAVATAHDAGLATVEIDADPFAEEFYLAMGAVRTGSTPSSVRPGRELPQLTFTVSSG